MIEKIKALCARFREQLLYLIFGGLTTLVDWVVSFLLYRVWDQAIDAHAFVIHGANVIAWVAAVLFAFFTNRKWVFESTQRGVLPILGELCTFAGGRVLTFLLQETMVAVFFDWLGLNKYAVKLIAAVLVVILNYVISKLVVFRKKK
ncbi:MAG: GtrA family protein [Clostridia bacterium]|nr:GtrA family protein [Clostridia bacterium]